MLIMELCQISITKSFRIIYRNKFILQEGDVTSRNNANIAKKRWFWKGGWNLIIQNLEVRRIKERDLEQFHAKLVNRWLRATTQPVRTFFCLGEHWLVHLWTVLYYIERVRRYRSEFGLVNWSSTVAICLYLFGLITPVWE